MGIEKKRVSDRDIHQRGHSVVRDGHGLQPPRPANQHTATKAKALSAESGHGEEESGEEPREERRDRDERREAQERRREAQRGVKRGAHRCEDCGDNAAGLYSTWQQL